MALDRQDTRCPSAKTKTKRKTQQFRLLKGARIFEYTMATESTTALESVDPEVNC